MIELFKKFNSIKKDKVRKIRHKGRQINNYNKLKKYKEIHGNCLIRQGYQKDLLLEAFVKTQCIQCRMLQQGKPPNLKPIYLKLLNGIKFEQSIKVTNI